MPRREPGVQAPRVASRPGKEPHNSCQQPAPPLSTGARDCRVPPRDSSSSSWQGQPLPSPPAQPDPSQGLEGKLRHEGEEEQP